MDLCRFCGERHAGFCPEFMEYQPPILKEAPPKDVPSIPGEPPSKAGDAVSPLRRPLYETRPWETVPAETPWQQQGMSRATWFRRQREIR